MPLDPGTNSPRIKSRTRTIPAPRTGPPRNPPPQPREYRDALDYAASLSGISGIQNLRAFPSPDVATIARQRANRLEENRLLQIGSAQSAIAARMVRQWNDRIALSDAQEVFRLMNNGYNQALVAAEYWAEQHTPPEPSLGGGGAGGAGYGGYGSGGGGRDYALSLGLYNWRIS